MVIETYISIITFSVNRLNALIKRYRLAEWIQKQDSYILSTRDPLQAQGHIQSENEGMEKDIALHFNADGNHKHQSKNK